MAASEIEKLERLVRENPKGRQFAILADAYRKDGQFQRALDVLAPGLEVHPDYVSARVVLGRVHVAMGEKAKAREAFARVIALDPESVIALKALADLAEQEGEPSEALRWSGQLLAVDPGNEEAIKQTERLTAAAPPEPRLSGIVPLDMGEAPAAEVTSAPTSPEKTVEIVVPVISVQSLAPVFNAAPEPLDQEPEPLPIAPLSEEAATDAIAGSIRPMDALEPTAYGGAEDAGAPTEKLAGLDQQGVTAEEAAAIGAASGFEPTSGSLDTTEVPTQRMAGLEGIGQEEELEQEQEIELGASGANEFQVDSAAETLHRRSGANEFQVDSAAETLQRRSGVNEFQAPSDAELLETSSESGLTFIEPPVAEEPVTAVIPPVRAPQAPVFTPAALPPEDPEPAVAEPEPVVTEAMAELYASQGHLSAALEVYRELAMRDPSDPRFADRIVELEMFVGGGEVSAVQTFETTDAPSAELPYLEPPVEEIAEPAVEELAEIPTPIAPGWEPPPVPAAASLEAMELTEAPATTPSTAWHARETGGTPIGSWLASVFAESLPVPAPAPTPAPVAPAPAVEALVSDVAPRGAPTRPASGSFSLSNVFGDQGAAPKSGSFDDFFGAPKPTQAAPSEPGAPSVRPRTTNQPPADDDLSSFQDWLKGLKQ